MLRRAYVIPVVLVICLSATAQEGSKKKPIGARWSPEKAAAWHKEQPWLVGCNFIPSTAVNQLEMWQKESFDPKTIDRELGWAADLGFTSVRVFLHDLPWKADRNGFVNRIDEFLRIADRHRIRVMFVLLDSCWHPEPKLGKQPAPTPHVHNSGWVQSPGVAVLKDPQKWKEMQKYVQDIVHTFSRDRRILCWDLWNEPENNNASSYGKRDIKNKEAVVLPLVKQVFAWAREKNPTQPITAAPWIGDWSDEARLSPLNRFLFDNSDIITFHRYENLAETKKAVETLRRYGRPILCTEFMARPAGSRFGTHLPYFHKENVGAYCWGFVAGKTQTNYPWDSWQKKYEAEPKVWFHDILRPDGKPYDAKEVKQIKDETSKRVEVKLRTSVETLDPLKPGNSFMECTIRNGTDSAVTVPSVYSGGWDSSLVLTANRAPGGTGLWHELRLVLWAGPKTKTTKLLQPGEVITVFKDDLRAILLLDGAKNAGLIPNQKRYYWSWSA